MLALVAVTFVAPAEPAPRALPEPSLTVPGALEGLAAAGSRVAALGYCDVRVAKLVKATKQKARPVRVRGLRCGEGFLSDIWLGRRSLVVELLEAESPHGEAYSLWKGPLPSGPVRQLHDYWAWTDSDPDEPAYGCEGVVVAGGGVIASTQVPNRLGVEHFVAEDPTCLSTGKTVIALDGAARARTTVQGSWTLLATDGKRLALSRLDREGRPTGELSLVGLAGNVLSKPRVSRATVRGAREGWLAREGLVLSTRTGLVGPGWAIRAVYAATVGYGRVLYLRGNALRARRIRGGADRLVLTLPKGSQTKLVAAASFGVAVAVQTRTGNEGHRVSVYRIRWRIVDAVLPRR